MAGELVPLVMIPRYTTIAGDTNSNPPYPTPGFMTVGMDVSEYDGAIINVWRGPIILTAGTAGFKVNCEESTDQNVWTICDGTTANTAVSENVEKQFLPVLTKRWFRVRVVLEGTNPVVTCWAVGYLVQRLR